MEKNINTATRKVKVLLRRDGSIDFDVTRLDTQQTINTTLEDSDRTALIRALGGVMPEDVAVDPRTAEAVALRDWLEANPRLHAVWYAGFGEWNIHTDPVDEPKWDVLGRTITEVLSAANAKLHPEPVETEAEAEAWIIAEASDETTSAVVGISGDRTHPRFAKRSQGWYFWRPGAICASNDCNAGAVAAKAAYLEWRAKQ